MSSALQHMATSPYRGDCIQVYKHLLGRYNVNWSNLTYLQNSVEYPYVTKVINLNCKEPPIKQYPIKSFLLEFSPRRCGFCTFA